MKNEIKKRKARELQNLTRNTKWIAYDEILDFLKWQFDDEFADQQINLFHVVKGRIYVSKRNR